MPHSLAPPGLCHPLYTNYRGREAKREGEGEGEEGRKQRGGRTEGGERER